MAGASLLTLLDDIATILDDVSVMSKIAAKKTAGVLGDDLALNAEKVTGVNADRELPVVWAVAKGSFLNKLILVPAALAISAVAPWLITPLLMLGGLFLCYEGAEKVLHTFFHKKDDQPAEKPAEDFNAATLDAAEYEAQKIKGAVRTDFILSAEIIVITLGVVSESSFLTQVFTLFGIAFLMTIGVYGLVAIIVKIDDAGLYLSQKAGRVKQTIGRGLLSFAPYLMKGLSIVGTVAMFLVGGGILTHGVHVLSELITDAVQETALIPSIGAVISALVPTLLNGLIGLIAGLILVGLMNLFNKLKPITP
ncbi:DUF808 domain-containing protein [Grimontia hollisae]|uniref:Inner membrane protein YedI n=1 Tax=Grimontia hollisae CIP 101886 TaxID=675812 RepID=D0I6K8_GRIHO|nr:DUF808 domain-containing protein [Grimontia hollisae]AMG31535.1 DUF808 domain-containing protein [Grimontia hollisae]EEY72277.1 protein of unknown function DUF808 [Grimontia hollisae CIP 101886]STO45406.1 Inner membrane protein yedI [Grimontia hollisae]